MIRNTITCVLVLALSLAADTTAKADGHLLRLHASGAGLFSPANVGQTGQPGLNIIFGDGSGLSAYKASGQDFTLNGHQFGLNTHLGAVQSFTSGIAQTDGTIAWPAQVAPNPYIPGHQRIHVMGTALGNIYLFYTNPPTRFVLFPTTNIIQGQGDLHVVGGTGRFHHATGLVKAVTTSNLATDVTPQGVKFKYVFDGIIKTAEDDIQRPSGPTRAAMPVRRR